MKALPENKTEKLIAYACQIAFMIMVLVFIAKFANAESTSGGGYTTEVKIDFITGNTTNTRAIGGFTPVGLNYSTSTYCWRLGIFGVQGCGTFTPPIETPGGCGDYDYRQRQTRIGLRRIAWVQSGLNKFNALPDDE